MGGLTRRRCWDVVELGQHHARRGDEGGVRVPLEHSEEVGRGPDAVRVFNGRGTRHAEQLFDQCLILSSLMQNRDWPVEVQRPYAPGPLECRSVFGRQLGDQSRCGRVRGGSTPLPRRRPAAILTRIPHTIRVLSIKKSMHVRTGAFQWPSFRSS